MNGRVIQSETEMKWLGEALGAALEGGEVLELIGDVGAGKTTLTKGIAAALGITEPVQSPTFTISRVYLAPGGLELHHYDFYRLGEAGIMGDEIQEVMARPENVTVVEWAGAVDHVLPDDRLVVKITATSEDERQVEMTPMGERARGLLRRMEDAK